MEPRCTVKWNPGRWPYVTSCVLEHGHPLSVPHRDKDGKTIPNMPGQIEHEGDQ